MYKTLHTRLTAGCGTNMKCDLYENTGEKYLYDICNQNVYSYSNHKNNIHNHNLTEDELPDPQLLESGIRSNIFVFSVTKVYSFQKQIRRPI